MTRAGLAAGLGLWAGATLLLSHLRWFARPPLAERLQRYAPQGAGAGTRPGVLSMESFRDAVGPLAREVGGRVSALLGVHEDAALRLARIHAPMDATAFRVRQVGWSFAAFGAGALAVAAARAPLPVAAVLVLGGPVLAYLVLEQQLGAASRRWQRRVFLELPVVAEQLAMLLSAGYSLSAALNRVAGRGRGACAQDLARVCARVRQGLSEAEALREWAVTVRVPAVDRLVPVLALNREASDLGRLLSAEARVIRSDVHRELVQHAERRNQQVWVPVTVATLLPGMLFLAIPFIEALRLFAG
jgi:tight adherence protein C